MRNIPKITAYYTVKADEPRISFKENVGEEIKGIRTHSKVSACVHNFFSKFGFCSSVMKVEGTQEVLYLNKKSCIRWLNDLKIMSKKDAKPSELIQKINDLGTKHSFPHQSSPLVPVSPKPKQSSFSFLPEGPKPPSSPKKPPPVSSSSMESYQSTPSLKSPKKTKTYTSEFDGQVYDYATEEERRKILDLERDKISKSWEEKQSKASMPKQPSISTSMESPHTSPFQSPSSVPSSSKKSSQSTSSSESSKDKKVYISLIDTQKYFYETNEEYNEIIDLEREKMMNKGGISFKNSSNTTSKGNVKKQKLGEELEEVKNLIKKTEAGKNIYEQSDVLDISSEDISDFEIFRMKSQCLALNYLHYIGYGDFDKYREYQNSSVSSLRGKLEQMNYTISDKDPPLEVISARHFELNYHSKNTKEMVNELREIFQQSGPCVVTYEQPIKWKFLEALPAYKILEESEYKDKNKNLCLKALVQFHGKDPEWLKVPQRNLTSSYYEQNSKFRYYSCNNKQEESISYFDLCYEFSRLRGYNTLRKRTLHEKVIEERELLLREYIDESLDEKLLDLKDRYTEISTKINKSRKLRENEKRLEEEIESINEKMKKIKKKKKLYEKNEEEILKKIDRFSKKWPLIEKNVTTEKKWAQLLFHYHKILFLEEGEKQSSSCPFVSWGDLEKALQNGEDIPFFESRIPKNAFIEKIDGDFVTFLDFDSKLRRCQKIKDFVQRLKPERWEGKNIIGLVSIKPDEEDSSVESSDGEYSEESSETELVD